MSYSQDSYKVVDYLNIFIRYKKIILIFSFAVTLVTGFIMFVIVDPIYYSYGTIKTTSKSGDLSSLLGGGTAISGMDFGELAGGGSTYKELALFENIIMSRRCLEEVIMKYDVMGIEDFKYFEDAIKYFRKNVLEIQKDKVAGTLEIGVYDKDPKRAKEIAEHIINSLNNINIELNVRNAKNNREFIETRYNLAKQELRNTEDSLKMFQDIYGIAPDLQIKAATQIGLQLEAEAKAEEVKLEVMKKILSDDQPEIKQQKEKISIIKEQINKMRNTADDTDMLTLKGKPDIAIRYLRLARNVEIQNKILTFVLPLYEQAKIEEKRETPTLLIIDNPFIPDKKAKPARLTITWLSFLIAMVLSFGVFVIYEKWKYYRSLGYKNTGSET